jgi:hypothetical protein
MELFELTKSMFGDTNNYGEATKGDKKKNFFMINRRMAIQHPMQAQALNGLRIDPVSAVDIWKRFLGKQYNKTPFWMYTKGVKKAKEDKDKKINIPSADILEYAKAHNYDPKTVKDALDMFPKEVSKEIKDFIKERA